MTKPKEELPYCGGKEMKIKLKPVTWVVWDDDDEEDFLKGKRTSEIDICTHGYFISELDLMKVIEALKSCGWDDFTNGYEYNHQGIKEAINILCEEENENKTSAGL